MSTLTMSKKSGSYWPPKFAARLQETSICKLCSWVLCPVAHFRVLTMASIT